MFLIFSLAFVAAVPADGELNTTSYLNFPSIQIDSVIERMNRSGKKDIVEGQPAEKAYAECKRRSDEANDKLDQLKKEVVAWSPCRLLDFGEGDRSYRGEIIFMP